MKTKLLLLLTAGLSLVVGCRAEKASTADALPEDVPLQSYQSELLEIAFATATALPADPHIKDQAKCQEQVVEACLQLNQPNRALAYLEQISNWRRGTAYADLALHCVQRKFENVAPYLARAAQVAEETEDWRKDRIRVKIAQTETWLGRMKEEAAFEAGLKPSESGKVARIKAMLCDDDSFDEQIETLDGYVATGDFDITKNSLQAYVQLFNRFYSVSERRALAEAKMKASWGKIPLTFRIDALMQCARIALDHRDRDKAGGLVNEAQAILEDAQWPPRFEIPLRAKLAALRFRVGEQDRARDEIRQTLALFDQHQPRIVNIERAGTLRPLAEAYLAMGDIGQALRVYRQTLEAGVENPNSRPRAEDLVATCCSMVLHGAQPDAEMMSRIRAIYRGLGDPW